MQNNLSGDRKGNKREQFRREAYKDIMEMMSYNIMTTPAVVVDGEVRMKGQVPSESDVKRLLGI